jgi:ribosomal protein L37AE/L43A
MIMMDKFRQFMAGRYGSDALGNFFLVLTAVFLVLNVLFRHGIFSLLAAVTLVICYYRMFSKNRAKRSAENGKYLFYKQKYFGIFSKKRKQMLDLKTHHIYRCPKCRQKIRIPRGKGMIEVRCPKCSMIFKKKS